MQKENTEDFSDVWKSQSGTTEMPQPPFPFSDNEDFQSNITIELMRDFPEYLSPISNQTPSPSPPGNQSSGFQCNTFPASNGMMRSYSGELSQPINQQTNLPTMSTTHQVMQHVAYHTTSPNAADATSSTHNSPFTPSPPQSYDYPTSPHIKPSIPPNTDYPGDYNFSINFGEITESAPKSAQYTYSPSLNKLFVKMNVTCPIRFKCDTSPPMDCIVRAVPVFKRPEHVTDIVTRCPNHKIPDEANYLHSSAHLIRADMANECVRYDVAPDMRESVVVQYEGPQIGAEYTTILYKFMCLSSCVGGINRRPLMIVFILENQEGQVLGRRVVEVRICSCPGRDRSQEEKRKFSESSATTSNGHDKSIKRSSKNIQSTMEGNQGNKKRRIVLENPNDEEFMLKIRGRDKFLLLKQMKAALDLMEYVPPQQQEAYRNSEEEEQAMLRQIVTTESSTQHNHPTSRATVPTSTSAITTLLTVSEPISSDAVASSLLRPIHSSHPLTSTPTGVMPPSPSSMYPTSTSQQYWTVNESQLGRDVPDRLQTELTCQPQASHKRIPYIIENVFQLPSTSSPLIQEMSAVSTSIVSSSSEHADRYVTHSLLRQRNSLNCDNVNQSATCSSQLPGESSSWENTVKAEKKGDKH